MGYLGHVCPMDTQRVKALMDSLQKREERHGNSDLHGIKIGSWNHVL